MQTKRIEKLRIISHGVVFHAELARDESVGSFRRFPEKPTNRSLQPIYFSCRFQEIKIASMWVKRNVHSTIKKGTKYFWPL